MAQCEESADLTYEQALAELEDVVAKLEAGGLGLETSLALFERGRELSAYCSAKLDQAEVRIKQLTPEGEVAFDLQD